MKKFAASLAAAAAMTAGVLTMSATDANAAYVTPPKAAQTTVKAPKHIEPGHKATVKLTVKVQGNHPAAKVRFIVRNKAGKLVAVRTHAFKKHVSFTTPKLKKGKYTLIAKVVGKGGKLLKGSRSTTKLSVN